MRVMITGGRGFIGSHLVSYISKQAQVESIVVADNRADCEIDRDCIIEKECVYRPIVYCCVDVQDGEAIRKIIRRYSVTHVVHLAGLAGVRESLGRFEEYYRTNVVGSHSVFQACLTSGVSVCLAASSSTVYGDSRTKSTGDLPGYPKSPYGWSKWLQELVIPDSLTCSFGALRLFSVYGWPCPRHLFIPALVRAFIAGTPFRISDPMLSRDFTHVEDVCEVMYRLLLDPPRKRFTFDVGPGQPTELRKVITCAERLWNRRIETLATSSSDLDARTTCADPRPLQEWLGKFQWTNIESGLEIIARSLSMPTKSIQVPPIASSAVDGESYGSGSI